MTDANARAKCAMQSATPHRRPPPAGQPMNNTPARYLRGLSAHNRHQARRPPAHRLALAQPIAPLDVRVVINICDARRKR